MLNWRRDPEWEMRLREIELREIELREIELREIELREIERQIERKRLRSEIEQLEKEHALLDWIESEIDLIEADLPSTSTPPPPIDASCSAC
jgi:hypothetical protein